MIPIPIYDSVEITSVDTPRTQSDNSISHGSVMPNEKNLKIIKKYAIFTNDFKSFQSSRSSKIKYINVVIMYAKTIHAVTRSK